MSPNAWRCARAALGCWIAAAAFAAAAEEPKQALAQTAAGRLLIARATVVLQNLQAGRFSPVLDEMHHPPQETEAVLTDDRRALSVALQYLVSRFGKLESYELVQEPVECACLALAMAADAYWSKLPESDRGGAVTFATRHAKIESGIVRITETKTGGGWLRSIEFGVPATTPGATDQLTRIARGMVERMQAVTRKPKPKAPPPQPE